MRTPRFRRSLGLILVLVLVLAAPLAAGAEEEAKAIELTADHVSLEKNEYEYTGKAIQPNVTVRAEGSLLTLDKHYSLEYADNIQPGQGKVIVTGIAAEGYTGTVEVPFTIAEQETEPEQTQPIELEAGHVKLEKTEFTYEGTSIEPAVTVTVDGKVLTRDTDYTLSFENNDKVGDAYVIITARDGSGYAGTVKVKFTIQQAPKSPSYTITKGNNARWTLKNTKALSFTANGAFDQFVSVSIDGKKLADSSYTAESGSTIISLKPAFLNTLKKGEHTITIHFADGDAAGAFTILDASDGTNPNTGDNVHLWTALLFISLTGLAGAGFAIGKKLRK